MESGVRQTGTAAAFSLSFRPVTAFPFSHALLFMTLPLTHSPNVSPLAHFFSCFLPFISLSLFSFPSCPYLCPLIPLSALILLPLSSFSYFPPLVASFSYFPLLVTLVCPFPAPLIGAYLVLSFDSFPHLPVLLLSGFLSRLFSFFAPFPPLSSFSSPLLPSSSSFLLSPLPPLPYRAGKVTIRCTQGVWTSCVGTQPKQIFL